MKQSFSQWQANPAQGAMQSNSPLTSADEAYLAEVATECRVRLESALHTAERYRSQVPELATALADAVTACRQASTVLNDLPTYSDGGQG
jgi:hypothetical protein